MCSISKNNEIDTSFEAKQPGTRINKEREEDFYVKLFIGSDCDEKDSIEMSTDMQLWMVIVRMHKFQANPSPACLNVSQTMEWKFQLASSVDPTTFEYERDQDSLILRAKVRQENPVSSNKGLKRKEIDSDIDDCSVKRARIINDDEEKISEDSAFGDDYSDDETEKEEDDVANFLPIEIISHILSFLDDPNEIQKFALINKNWQAAVKMQHLPHVLIIDEEFLKPMKYLEFMEVFQHTNKLPFHRIVYWYEKSLNNSQHNVLEFIKERGTGVFEMKVLLYFEQRNGLQVCPILDWVSEFENCKSLSVRFKNIKPDIQIDYGNCNLSHLKALEIPTPFYHEMQEKLCNRFPRNDILFAYKSAKV